MIDVSKSFSNNRTESIATFKLKSNEGHQTMADNNIAQEENNAVYSLLQACQDADNGTATDKVCRLVMHLNIN